MTMDELTPISLRPRWQRAAEWIEKYCVSSDGADRGHSVHLSSDELAQLRQIFELGNPPPADLGRMSAFIALIGLCGPEHLREVFSAGTGGGLLERLARGFERGARRASAAR
jgi:hypothetical protein